MRRAPLIGSTAAAALLNRSPQIVRYWARSGRLRPARTRPTIKFRIEDVLSFSPPPPRPGSGRPRGNSGNTQLQSLLKRMVAA